MPGASILQPNRSTTPSFDSSPENAATAAREKHAARGIHFEGDIMAGCNIGNVWLWLCFFWCEYYVSISIYDINICLEGGLPILEREIYLDCRCAFSGKDSWTNHTLKGSNSNYDSWLCWLHFPFHLEKTTESFESFVKLSSLWYRFNHSWSVAATYIVASIFHLKSNKLRSVCPLVTVLLVCMFQAQTQVELGILTILVLPSMQESAWFGAGLSWTTNTAILWGIPAGESEQKIAWWADTHLVARSASHHYPQHTLWQVCWTGCLVNMGKALYHHTLSFWSVISGYLFPIRNFIAIITQVKFQKNQKIAEEILKFWIPSFPCWPTLASW